jgi:hypothetical protein
MNLSIKKFSELAAKVQTLKDKQYDNVSIFLNADEDGVKFAGDKDMMKVFDKALMSIKGVKTSIDLDIRDNYLNDKKLAGIKALLEANTMISKLILYLPANFITDRGFRELLTTINNLKELRTLNLNFEW